jgi:hypothetical protein
MCNAGVVADLLHYFFFGLAADSPVAIDPYISTGISLRHDLILLSFPGRNNDFDT